MTWHRYQKDMGAGRKSAATQASYRQALHLLSEHLAAGKSGRDLMTCTGDDIADWLADGAAVWAGSTHATYARRARTFFQWALMKEYRDDHPMAKLPKVIEGSREIELIDPADVRKMLATCKGKTFDDRRDRAMLCVLCEPGTPRATELATMLLEELDMRHDEFRILGKGRKERTVPFGAGTGHALTLYLRTRKEHRHAKLPYVWLGKRGAITRYGVRQIIEHRCALAGIPFINPHAFRHLTAHAWFEDEGSLGDAKKLFGWASDTMPARYGAAAAGSRARKHARERSLGDRLTGES